MTKTKSAYAIVSCWHESFQKAKQVPSVPPGRLEASLLRKIAAPAEIFAIRVLEDGCSSFFLHVFALWVVVQFDDAVAGPMLGRLTPEALQAVGAEVLTSGQPREVCAWLLERGLPTPGDDARVTLGRNTERVKSDSGVVVGARFGAAEAGFLGMAYTFMGETRCGPLGVAVTAIGEARSDERGAAICSDSGSAQADGAGVAVSLGEFSTSRAGSGGVAVARDWGSAVAGPGGIAVGLNGPVQAGAGGLLIVRYRSGDQWQCAVARVGENGVMPDRPYRFLRGRFVQAQTDQPTDFIPSSGDES
ncbi:MAG: hypothetical protein IT436_00095 [Phycisphaerales bacterium]|nr:hypothetical protein [Phycisphaerales bacterium]